MPKEIRTTHLVCGSQALGGQAQAKTTIRARKLLADIAEARAKGEPGLWLPTLSDGYDQFVSMAALDDLLVLGEVQEWTATEAEIQQKCDQIAGQIAMSRMVGPDGRPLAQA